MRLFDWAAARSIAMRLAATTGRITPSKIPRPRRGSGFVLLGAVVALSVNLATAETTVPSGRAVIAWHVTIPPSWFDPSTAPPQITPFGMLYAIHDALVRPYPGQKMGPSLAESWEESEDGLVYEPWTMAPATLLLPIRLRVQPAPPVPISGSILPSPSPREFAPARSLRPISRAAPATTLRFSIVP